MDNILIAGMIVFALGVIGAVINGHLQCPPAQRITPEIDIQMESGVYRPKYRRQWDNPWLLRISVALMYIGAIPLYYYFITSIIKDWGR